MVLFRDENIDLTGSLENFKNVHTDCLLVDGGVRVRCHSVVLSSFSVMLRNILPEPNDDKEDSVIILPDRGEDVIELVVKLLRDGEVTYRASSDQKQNIMEVMTSLGLGGKKLKLHDVPFEIDKISLGEGADHPDFRVGPVYEDERDMPVDVDDPLTSGGPFHDVIRPVYDDSNDGADDGDDFQDGNCQQLFHNSSSQLMFHLPSNERSSCCKTCQASCQSTVDTWSSIQKMSLKSLFHAEQKIDVKKKLLSHLGSQEAIGLSTNNYIINNHRFCTNFLSVVTGISLYILKSVMSDFSRGKKIYEHANAGIVKVRAANSVFIAWLKEFAECYGQDSPDENLTVLSYWLSKKVLYDMYLDETVGPHLSQSSFYENFKAFFGPNRQDKCLPQIRISKYSSHSVCNICTALNTNRRQAKNEEEQKIAKDKINHHKEEFGQARGTVDKIIQSAITHPTDNLGMPYIILNNNCGLFIVEISKTSLYAVVVRSVALCSSLIL